jgi:hypothetical protein
MFFSILLIIFFLFLFLLGTIGYGKLLHFLLFKRIINDNFGEYGLLGLIFISLLSTFFHFFFSIDTRINFIIYFSGLFFAYNFYSEIKIFIKKNKYILSVFFFISFLMVIFHKPNEDFGYYHLPYLINFTSDKIIFGLANVQTNQGWNSMWLNLTATYNLPLIRMNGIHLTNVIFFFFFSLAILEPILNSKNYLKTKKKFNNLINIFSVLFFLYFVTKFSRLGKYGFDIPSNFIAIYCFYLFLYFFSLKKDSIFIKNYIFQKIIIFSFFSVLIKLSNFLILLLPAFIFFRREIKMLSKTFLFIFIFIFIWSIQQFIYTGCFFYPLIVSCLDMSWFNLDPVLDLLNHTKGINKSFAQYQGNLSELEYSKNFNWVPTWFSRNKIEMLEHLLTFVVIFFLLILIFFRKKITRYNKITSYKYSIFYLLLFIIFLQILFWFNTSPVVRFGFHYVLLFLFFLLSLIFYKFLLKTFVYKHVIFLIYIGLTINIQKNLFRIYEDIKINNTFFYTYPKIFFKNENIVDKKININYLIKDKSIYCWDTPSLCLAGQQNLIIDRVNGYLVIVKK